MSVKHVLLVVILLALLAGCGPTPEPETIVQTVEVEKTVIETVEVETTVIETVEVETTVIETVEVEVEKTVIETVEVESEKKVVTVAVNPFFNMSLGPVDPPREVMTAAIAEKYPNIELQFVVLAGGALGIHSNYTTWFISQDPTIDLVWFAGYWNTEFGDAGWTMPLDDLVDPELIAEFDQDYLDTYRSGGSLRGIGPVWAGIGALYYRSDLLEEYDLEPPETYDDIIAACDTIQADYPDMTCWGWPAVKDTALSHRWAEYLYGFGGQFFDDDGKCAMNSTEGVAALEFMVGLIEDGYSPQDVLGWDEVDAHARFVNGLSIFQTGRQDLVFWLDDPARSQIAGKWGIVANPAQAGGRHTGTFDGWAFGINSFTDVPEEALQVLEVFSTLDIQKVFTLAWGPIQGNTGVYTDPEVLEHNPNLPMIEDLAETALGPLPSANYGEISDILVSELHSALAGSTDPQTALDTVCSMVDEIESLP